MSHSYRSLQFSWAWMIALAVVPAAGQAADPPAPKLTPLSLAPGSIFLTMDAPEGASAKASVKSAIVTRGERWRMNVREMEEILADVIEDSKKSYRENKASKVVLDTKEAFVAGIPLLGDDTYVCYAIVAVGGKRYLCTSEGADSTEKEARLIATCAATLRRTAANTQEEKAYDAAVEELDSLGCEFKDAFNHLVLEGDEVKDEHLKLLKDIPFANWVIVRDARLSPAGLRRLHDLPNLESVSFEGKPATDAWLEPIANLPKLRLLWLKETSVTAAGWKTIAKLARLTQLRVSGSKIDGQVLKNLASLTALDELDLSESTLGASGLEHLAAVKSLRTVNLAGTNVDDAGIKQLERCIQLFSLDLSDTAVTPSGIAKLKLALPKCSITQ